MLRLRGTDMSPWQTDSRQYAAAEGPSPTGFIGGQIHISGTPPSPIQRIGYWFLLVYLFVSLSRVLDVTLNVRAASVLYAGIVLVALTSGGVFLILKTGVGRSMLALIVWLALTLPLSTWPGGSLDSLIESAKAFFLGVAIIAIPRTAQETSRLLKTVAFAILGATVLTWFYGRLDLGRLVLDKGTYADPNQLSMTLLMAIPLWVMVAQQARNTLVRIAAYACILPILIAFLRTGSRGGLVGLAVMLLIAFFSVSARQKLLLIVSMGLLLMLSMVVLPSYLQVRYLTVFSTDDEAAQGLTQDEQARINGGDIGSSQGRTRLLRDSIDMTLAHPLFGVGMAQFPYVNWQRYHLHGRPAASVVTHNVYTQFSSEAGIPALIIFVVLLYQSFRTAGKVVRLGRKLPRYPEISSGGQALRLALVSLMACSFFLSVAYSQLFYVMAAIVARYYMTAQSLPSRTSLERPLPPQSLAPVRSPQPALAAPALAPSWTREPRSKLSPMRASSSGNVRNSRIS
jgi:O-antigen ligase